ncbi:MAG: Response regulator receiver protein [Pedosphaera sp.]|nr:Response regulator receiver protein [Pedosphaera sp.]
MEAKGRVRVMRFVLYVDQKNSDALLIHRAFERYGFGPHLQVVSSGPEAMAYLAGTDKYNDRILFPLPSLIILETNLVGLSAFDLVKWIRSCPPLARIPIVIFTAWELPSDLELAYSVGANSYILKSTDAQEFEQQVRQMIDFWLKMNVTVGKVPVGLEKLPPAPRTNGQN